MPRRSDSEPLVPDAGADAVLARARTALAQGDAAAAIQSLHDARPFLTRPLDRFAAETLLGGAFALVRDFAEADAHFDRARALLDRRSRPLTAALEAARGRRYVLESRIGDAWRCYEASLVDARIESRIESEGLKAEIHHAEGRFGEQAHSLMKLIALLAPLREAQPHRWFTSVATLAQLSCELYAPESAANAAAALTLDDAWPAAFVHEQFFATRALAWYDALGGNTFGLLRRLREAAAIAESLRSAPLRAIVLRDRALFARHAREEHWHANELASAVEALRTVDWSATGAAERSALPLVAEVLAPSDPNGAAMLLARYAALVPDPPGAIETAIYGVVHIANGRPNEGVHELRRAYDFFAGAGYEWRAGNAAIALAAATGEARWRLLALEHLEPYEHSWLYAAARQLDDVTNGADETLTPMQERVFTMICEGLSTDAIAMRLGRSRSTVRNHIKLIFKAMGVRSRAALVAKAARKGSFRVP